MNGTLKAGVIQVAAKPGIKAQALHGALDRILTAAGCPGCGLGGFDLRFTLEDERFSDQLRGLDGISHVSHFVAGQ
jgi:hypothetical protein